MKASHVHPAVWFCPVSNGILQTRSEHLVVTERIPGDVVGGEGSVAAPSGVLAFGAPRISSTAVSRYIMCEKAALMNGTPARSRTSWPPAVFKPIL